ncbi:MAG: hypothetical protein ABIH85_06100 [Candidatus Omnitrophota bacterium]
MSIRALFRLVLVFLICVFCCNASRALSEKQFFSYKRFSLNQGVAVNLPSDGKIHNDINAFVANFSEGLSSFSAKKYDESQKYFLTARKAWPEYFNTDFCIAMLYEKEGKYKKASQYYKSYLEKLKSFHQRKYVISESLILSFTSGNIDDYDYAYVNIKTRLAKVGIDIDKIKIPFRFTGFLVVSAILGVVFLMYLFNSCCIAPYLKKRYRMKHVSEGFWVCPNCIEVNPNLVKECGKCGRPRVGRNK